MSFSRTVYKKFLFGGFTLVELLSVLAILGFLFALLLPVLTVARRKSQDSVCFNNLRQLGIAIRQYRDDYDDKRPPTVEILARSTYVSSADQLMHCRLDFSRNWGGLLVESIRPANIPSESVEYSYVFCLPSLTFDELTWQQMVAKNDESSGIAVCQLHGASSYTGEQRRLDTGKPAPPTVLDYEGLVLRLQVDGAVVRRHISWQHTNSTTFGNSAALFFDHL